MDRQLYGTTRVAKDGFGVAVSTLYEWFEKYPSLAFVEVGSAYGGPKLWTTQFSAQAWLDTHMPGHKARIGETRRAAARSRWGRPTEVNSLQAL